MTDEEFLALLGDAQVASPYSGYADLGYQPLPTFPPTPDASQQAVNPAMLTQSGLAGLPTMVPDFGVDIMNLPPTPPNDFTLQQTSPGMAAQGLCVPSANEDRMNTIQILLDRISENVDTIIITQQEHTEKLYHLETKVDKILGGLAKFSADVCEWTQQAAFHARPCSDAGDSYTLGDESSNYEDCLEQGGDDGEESVKKVVWSDDGSSEGGN